MTTALHRPAPAPPPAIVRPPLRTVLVTCLVVLAVRVVDVWEPLRSDEGGYLYVARHWRSGGEFLYGDYHVDRPPLLMLLYRLAAQTGHDRAIRVLVIPFVLLLVVACARAAYLAAGPRAVGWAAVVAGAWAVSPALAAEQADGELFAAPLVAASIALTLDAWRRPAGGVRLALAVGAGVLAASATLVKQNFVEGFVFAVVLVAAASLRERRVGRRAAVVLGGGLVGAALPNLAVLVWASVSGIGELEVWTELAAFRQQAFDVIWAGHTEAPLRRAAMLLGLALVTALAGVAVAWLARRGPSTPVSWALNATLVSSLVSVAGGGSYWAHYLVQLVPPLALAAGIVAARPGRPGRWMRGWVVVAVGSAVVGVVGSVVVHLTTPAVWWQQRTGDWLAAASRPGDSGVVAYGNPVLLETADLASPYPYLWSLPMRTLDPDQARLRSVLAGPDAPTWFVEVGALDSWEIDRGGRLRALLEERYDVAAVVCGHPVWLREDETRDLPPVPDC